MIEPKWCPLGFIFAKVRIHEISSAWTQCNWNPINQCSSSAIFTIERRQFNWCCSYFLGVPEGKPGELQLYRVSSVPPRTGATLPPPVCITCVKEPPPTSPPYLTLDESIYKFKKGKQFTSVYRRWHFAPIGNWEDDDEDTVITTPAPRKRKKQKQKLIEKEPPCLYHNAWFRWDF